MTQSENKPINITIVCEACGKTWVSSAYKSFECLSCGCPIITKPKLEIVNKEQDDKR